MSDSAAQLKREGTMAVTAQEGKEFLEAQGMPLTDDSVKTRGQKDTLDQITSEATGDTTNGDGAEHNDKPAPNGDDKPAPNGDDTNGDDTNGDDDKDKDDIQKPKLARDSTMAVTANEGAQFLEGEELEKTRGQTAIAREEEDEEDDSDISKLKRTSTVVQTTEDSHYILGNEEFGKTRSQTRKFSESEEVKKPAVKRTTTMAQTAKEGEEYLAREAKRSKDEVDEEDEQQKESVED